MLLLRSKITLRYYLDFVTVILTALSLQTYVVPRAVTEQTVTQSRRQVKFSVSKWLKLTQFHLFTPFFNGKKAILQRENLQDVRKTSHWAVNICLCAFRNWKFYREILDFCACLHNTDNLYRQPTMKIPELRWCLTEISFTYPSQFPGMF